MSDTDEVEAVRLRRRPSETVTLSIPPGTLEMIRRVAATRDMSPAALLKFYIGQGLRQDAARLYSERIMEPPPKFSPATSRRRKSALPPCARFGVR